MSKTLVIVESPTKAKTLRKYLGSDYVVESSVGHIRDLPGKAAEVPAKYKKLEWASLAVNVEEDFEPLFKGDMKEQGRKLMSTLKIAVKGLDDLSSLVPVVEKLGRDHAGFGVEAAHYATVADALLWTPEQGLGDDFTSEVRDAWASVYFLLAETMIAAAED
mgnify:CR=1 FL=1